MCSRFGLSRLHLCNMLLPCFHMCRTLTRSAGMMLVFRALTMSLAAMGNVTVVLCLNFIIFGIMGVNLFGGRFYSCNDTTVPNKVKSLSSELCVLCSHQNQQLGHLQWVRVAGPGCEVRSLQPLSAMSAGCGWCLPFVC